jgi:hypothetical protein
VDRDLEKEAVHSEASFSFLTFDKGKKYQNQVSLGLILAFKLKKNGQKYFKSKKSVNFGR